MIRFIDQHRHRRTEGLGWGVEPICAALQFASQTYLRRPQPVSTAKLMSSLVAIGGPRWWPTRVLAFRS